MLSGRKGNLVDVDIQASGFESMMRRIMNTVFAVVGIIVAISIVIQAQNAGAPWMFTAFGVVMIIGIVISVIRVWLRS